MPVDDRTRQPFGILHGGASVALAETLGSTAAGLVVDPDKYRCVGQEINANHVRAVSDGFVIGTARPLHLGRRSHVWEIRIADEQDRLVCISRITMFVIGTNSSTASGAAAILRPCCSRPKFLLLAPICS